MKLSFSDKNHSYYLDGKRCKSVTAIAKIPDDTYALEEWRKRMVATGMAMEPSLIEQVAAHFDDRAKMTELCEAAMVVAKSHVPAGLGTAAHRIAERVDLGEDIIDTPLSLAMRAAWTSALDKAGLDVIPEYVERIIVHPDHRVCGALDRIMRRRSDGRTVIVDLKTGEGAVKYPHSIACQLALYARAPFLAGPMGNPADKGTVYTETFEPMPADLDIETGYIVHAAGVVDGEVAEVLEVDIAAGWEVVERIIFPTLQWRKRGDIMRPILAVPIDLPSPATDDDFARANGEPSRRHQILARLTALPEAQKARIKAHWPHGVPGLKSKHEHTDAELDAIEAVVFVETALAERTKPHPTAVDIATLRRPQEEPCSLSTSSEASSTTATGESSGTSGRSNDPSQVNPSFSPRMGSTSSTPTFHQPTDEGPLDFRIAIDNGPLVPDADIDALRKAFQRLDTAEQLWLSVITTQSDRAGYPLNLGNGPTKRRWAIGTALVHLARLGVGSDDTHEATVRALLGVVMGEEIQPAVVTGSAVAKLTIDEAERLAVLAQEVGHWAHVDFNEDGTVDLVWGQAVEAARRVA